MKRLLLFLLFVSSGFSIYAQGFTPGNIVVSRYGDGIVPIPNDNITVPIFLDEYDLTGKKIQSLPMPVVRTEDTRNRVLTGSAKGYYEGLLTLSQNGQYLVNIGHNMLPGEEYRNNTQRTIGVTYSDGQMDIKTAVRPNIGVPRAATTNNGVNLWMVGSHGGLKYKKIGSIAPNDEIISRPPNGYNSVYIYNNQLYYTSTYVASEEGPKIGVVGEGLPTEADQTVTNLPGFPTNTRPGQMVMLDSDTDTPEPDLMYLAMEASGELQKWSFSGDYWEFQGSTFIQGTTDQIIGLTGNLSEEGNVNLYVSTSGRILHFSDPDAVTSDFSAIEVPVVLAEAEDNTVFRGISFTPGTTPKVHKRVASSSRYGSLIQKKTGLIQNITKNETTQPYPGVEETHLNFISNRGVPVAVHFLKVNLNNPNLSMETLMPNDEDAFALQKLSEMVDYRNDDDEEKQVIAASNGDYFHWTGEPDGAVHKDGVIIKELPEDKFFFGIRGDGTAVIGDHRIYGHEKDDLTEVISGRFFLMHYGEIMTDHLIDTSIEPRTTVGLLSENDVVFMWVDGRAIGYSAGLSLRDMAKIYNAIGATEAINLDGGGSSTFIMREKDGDYEFHNRPSDLAGERRVANGMAVLLKKEILDKKPEKSLASAQIKAFAVSPNPASVSTEVRFELRVNSEYRMEIYTDSGYMLGEFDSGFARKNSSNKKELEVSNLSTGIYFVKLILGSGESQVQKLIIK